MLKWVLGYKTNMQNKKVYKKDLLYPELSYKVVGILFDVFKELGYGHSEKRYQKAIEIGLKKIKYRLQQRGTLKGFLQGRIYINALLGFSY